jgi:NADH-quinone oxidoreductase subunit I
MKVEKKMGLKEQIYIIEVIRGLYVTSAHFFRNLLVHVAHVFGGSKHKRGAETIQYPEEVRYYAPRLRMRHRLLKRPDGTPRCVACYMCETYCPADCIHIVAEESPDIIIEKRAGAFDIDLSRCIYCGFCVEACPVDAIRMDIYENKITAYDRNDMVLTMKELLV